MNVTRLELNVRSTTSRDRACHPERYSQVRPIPATDEPGPAGLALLQRNGARSDPVRSRLLLIRSTLLAVIVSSVSLAYCGGPDTPTGPTPAASSPAAPAVPGTPPPAAPQCDASLWNHVYDPERLQVVDACRTVTGVITDDHSNDDGDIDIRLAVDPPYANLLNGGNISNLSGHLQTEAICQAPVQSNVPDALRACRNFTGTVPVPPVGTHVQVTGVYTLDKNHGWMELHPISVLSIVR